MKRKAPDAVAARARSLKNSFLEICLAAFLTTFSVSAAAPAPSTKKLNPAEKWVVERVTAGEEADLGTQFPGKERNLSSNFLEGLLMSSLPGVKLHRHGVRILGAIIDEPIELENAQIPSAVWLRHCQFNRTVTFESASFVGDVSFDDSVFTAPATFRVMKVGGAASFRRAVFEGPVDFGRANITGDLVATAAQFRNKEEANFNGMKVGPSAYLRNAVFEGPVDFGSADISGSFNASEAQFRNKEKATSFNSMRVGHSAMLQKAVFEGPVDFVGANISGSFNASEAQFRNKEKDATFDSMKVGGDAFFKDAVFAGEVSFDYTEFAWLDLSSPFWPKVGGKFRISGMSYKYVRAVRHNEPESHKALLKLADQTAYSADVYRNLEEFFLRQGYRGDAEEAFIAGKRRERKENLHGLNWLGSCLLDWLVGYGRRPWQAALPCAFFVALGCILYPLKKMTLQDPKELEKPEDERRRYNRFWYSLGLFLPVVDLKTSELWGPKPEYTFLRNYVRVHILLGWILVPLVLAALTGLIK